MVDQKQSAPAFRYLGNVGRVVDRAGDHRFDRSAREVRDRHGQSARIRGDLDVQLGAGVHDRVGGQLGGQQQRLVEQPVEVGLGEHGAHERAGRGRRASVGGQAHPAHVLRCAAETAGHA